MRVINFALSELEVDFLVQKLNQAPTQGIDQARRLVMLFDKITLAVQKSLQAPTEQPTPGPNGNGSPEPPAA